MKSKKFYLISFSSLFSLFILFFYMPNVFAFTNDTPALIDKLNKAFESIEGWIFSLATPAAVIAVASGVFMQKFSFGDEEKIRTGKKIVRGSIFSYGFLLAINLILSLIKSLIT